MSKYAKFRAAAAAAVLPNQPPSSKSEEAPEAKKAPVTNWATTFEGARQQVLDKIDQEEKAPQETWEVNSLELVVGDERYPVGQDGTILAPAPKVAADEFHAFDDVSRLMPGLYVGDDEPADILPPEAAPALGNVPPELKTVESLGLKGSIVKALMREGITSLSDLLALGEDHNWQSITGIGAKAVDEVRAAIRANAPAELPTESEEGLDDILPHERRRWIQELPPLIAVSGTGNIYKLLAASKGWQVVRIPAVMKESSPVPNSAAMIASIRLATVTGLPSVVVFEVLPRAVREFIEEGGGLVVDITEEVPF